MKFFNSKHHLSQLVFGFDLSEIEHRVKKTLKGTLTDDEVRFATNEYRRFLLLFAFFPQTIFSPSNIIDEVWHAHILYTKLYREHCQLLCNRFIDHHPEGSNEQGAYDGAYRNTLQHYRSFYISDAPDTIWGSGPITTKTRLFLS